MSGVAEALFGAREPVRTADDDGGFLDQLRPHLAAWDRANGPEDFPRERIAALHAIGGLAAFLTLPNAAAVDLLARSLRAIGGADLSLGRIFEGHVNAAQLVAAYGTQAQRAALRRWLRSGRVLGVWNTEPAPGMTIVDDRASGRRLTGAKSFATGAGEIDAALITARDAAGGRQLVLVDLTGQADRADISAWRVRGMRGTISGTFDFDGMTVEPAMLIGAPGDYEREPRFSAGAWRFAAVQIGAVEALLRHWRQHLIATGKGEDAIQRVRFAAGVAATRSAILWVERAAREAEAASAHAIPLVMMARGIVEEAALRVMEDAGRSVGTAAFFDGSRIDRITRDLSLYLRQPVPDQARDRAAAAWLAADHWADDPWW